MRWLACSLFVISLAIPSICSAQWISDQDGMDDRPKPSLDTKQHSGAALAGAQPELPDWLFTNIDITNDPDYDETEPAIALNPSDPSDLMVGVNDDRAYAVLPVYFSKDAGKSWTRVSLPSQTGSLQDPLSTDPSLSFSATGDAFYLNGRSEDGGIPFPRNEVTLFRSTNKGMDWSITSDPFHDTATFGSADTLSDKYYVAVDRFATSPFYGRIYAAWVDEGEDADGHNKSQIVLSVSSDDGVTWSRRTYLSDRGYYTAPVPAVAPDGTLLVVYTDLGFDQHSIVCLRSTDGGQTYSGPVQIGQYRDIGPFEPQGNQSGYAVIKGDVAVNSFPSIAIDSVSRRVYASWVSRIDNRTHVLLNRSDDLGQHWDSPRAIEIGDDTTDKFFSWVAVDPTTGVVGVAYYDSRDDPTNQLANLYLSLSFDRGETFRTKRISNASSDPRVGRDSRSVAGHDFKFFGDYINLVSNNGKWYPVWTDARLGYDLDIYTSIVAPMAPRPVEQLSAHDTTLAGIHGVLLTWDYDPLTTYDFPLHDYTFDVSRSDTSFEITLDKSVRTFFDTTAYRSSYRYGVQVKTLIDTSESRFVHTGSLGVSQASRVGGLSVHWAMLPGIVGIPMEVEIESDRQSAISIQFFDVTGREVGPQLYDPILRSSHRVIEIPDRSGVLFYRVTEESAAGVREAMGRIVVVR